MYTLSARPRRQVPSMLRQESRVKLRRDSAVSSSLGKVGDTLFLRLLTRETKNFTLYYLLFLYNWEN